MYSAQPENSDLRSFLAEHRPAVSALSYVEVLGYHQLREADSQYFQQFFNDVIILPISQAVLEQAVALRQMRRMTLGDAIIASTALVHGMTLVTRNTDDFRWITQLILLNPFDLGG
ncbi:MAG: type II toxin-antitoxin system VapC family toxin [Hormoscilla sp. GM7CHS1pb]|nr:type II toxin-antitoxin system VapC family toxin [Hormoscilla sp. GM7CHS1pb]